MKHLAANCEVFISNQFIFRSKLWGIKPNKIKVLLLSRWKFLYAVLK